MAARNIFRVMPEGDHWIVRKDGKVISTHQEKNSAIEAANKLANKQISSQVIVYRPDGSIQIA
ncbi:MAG: hypothetical protein Kow0042_10180 [Calditrichia bacterium]